MRLFDPARDDKWLAMTIAHWKTIDDICEEVASSLREVNGKRKQGGQFKVKGCDENGWPLDPARRWK